MKLSKAFTLIELLVVIAIIAILAAILFPVFAQAKAAAKGTTCLSDTKQINLGVTMYQGDSDDTYPLTHFYNGTAWADASTTTPMSAFGFTNTRNAFWSNSILPYIKNTGIYNCPAATKSRSDIFGVSLSQALGYTYSLTFNGYLNQYPASGVAAPARLITFSDGLGIGTMPRYANSFPLLISNSGGEALFIADDGGTHCAQPYGFGFNYDSSWWVHNKGSNYSYADGHSKHVANPSANSPWAALDTNGLPQSLWVDTVASSHNCNWYYMYAPTVQQ